MSTIIQYELEFNPIYVFIKKHYCPKCKGKMSISYTTRVVSLKEMKSKDRPFGELPLNGDVEIRTPFLWCPACECKMSLKEMKAYEKNK